MVVSAECLVLNLGIQSGEHVHITREYNIDRSRFNYTTTPQSCIGSLADPSTSFITVTLTLTSTDVLLLWVLKDTDLLPARQLELVTEVCSPGGGGQT